MIKVKIVYNYLILHYFNLYKNMSTHVTTYKKERLEKFFWTKSDILHRNENPALTLSQAPDFTESVVRGVRYKELGVTRCALKAEFFREAGGNPHR